MNGPEFQAALRLSDLRQGGMMACVLAGREIVVCRTKEGVFALDNICSHAHARMNEGRLRGLKLICPLHGAAFDVRTGSVLGPPANQPLCHHAVKVVGDLVEVAVDPDAPPQLSSF